jgi:hypothetical protein
MVYKHLSGKTIFFVGSKDGGGGLDRKIFLTKIFLSLIIGLNALIRGYFYSVSIFDIG